MKKTTTTTYEYNAEGLVTKKTVTETVEDYNYTFTDPWGVLKDTITTNKSITTNVTPVSTIKVES